MDFHRSAWLERAGYDLYNPEFITLMISVMNSRFKGHSEPYSDRRKMMKIHEIRVLKYNKYKLFYMNKEKAYE